MLMDPVGGDYPSVSDGGWAASLYIGHLLLLLLLIAIGVGLGLWLAAYRSRQRRALARIAIYEDIRYAVDRALKAQGGDLINASQRLLDTVASRLGPVLDLSTALSVPMGAISKALAGKITDPVKPEPPKAPALAAACKDPGATVIITPPSCGTTVNVIEAPVCEKPAAAEAAPEPAPAPKKPEERDMTLKEQLAALRAAVETFHGVWERRRVETMLSGAQATLLDSRPPPPRSDFH
jgi:hypothetical protein